MLAKVSYLFPKIPSQVWGVVSRAQEVASQLTSLSSAATPEQAQDNIISYRHYLSRADNRDHHVRYFQAKAIIENIFSSLHATMINAMKTCQNLLALATEASTQVEE